MHAFIIDGNTYLNLNKTHACFFPLWSSLHLCGCGILMPVCLFLTLLQVHHVYALKYDKPWLIEHYIQIFHMLVFSHCLQYATHLQFLRNFKNRYVIFADSIYVILKNGQICPKLYKLLRNLNILTKKTPNILCLQV